MVDDSTPFIWTRGQIDQMNKWCLDTTNTLHSMLAQLHIFHDQLYGDNPHSSSPDCPLCKDKVIKREKAEMEIIRKKLDRERDASNRSQTTV